MARQAKQRKTKARETSAATVGYEAELWQMADALRGSMDAAEYKHVVFELANPPFNISDWGGERLRDDKRWQYGAPAAGNANFAWVQHIVHDLAPVRVAGSVLANCSSSSTSRGIAHERF